MKLLVLLLGLLFVTACSTPPAAIIEGVSVTASSQNTFAGLSQVLFADVTGTGSFNKNVTWSTTAGVLAKTTGNVVTFTAPSVTSNTDVTVTAISNADSSKKDTVVIKVNPVPVSSSITAVAVTADLTSLNAASPAALTANVTGTNGFAPDVNWSIISGTGTISAPSGASIAFTAPSLASSSVTIVRATSVQDPSKSNTVSLNVNALPAGSSITDVAVTAAETTLNAATITTVSAVVTGTNGFGNGVLWNVVSGGGTISDATGSSITFFAPSLANSSTTILRATSVQDPSKSGVVTININALPPGSSITGVTVSSPTQTVTGGGSGVTLTATVTGENGFSDVTTWSIISGPGELAFSGINGTGTSVLFAPPSLSQSSLTIIRATSVQDPSKSGVITMQTLAGGLPEIIGVSVSTSSQNLNAATTATLKATVNGIGDFVSLVHWSIVSGGGTISFGNGSIITFTAPSLTTHSVTIVRATSDQDPSKSADVTLNINPVPPSSSITSVTVVSSLNPLNAAATATLTATVTGTNGFGNGVLWNIVSGGGTLSAATGSSVVFTAPSLVNASITIVRATSVQDPSKSGTVTLNINPSTLGSSISGVLIHASQVALREGDSSVLQGVVTGTGAFNNALTWNIEAGGGGTLSSNTGNTVSYTASASSFGRIVRITASSLQDPTQKKTLFVSVNPNKASIAAGENTSYALLTNGTVLSWGSDVVGQLGDDTNFVSQSTPVFAVGVTNVVAIAAGRFHVLALKSDGTLFSWGDDLLGELGDGGNTNQPTHVSVFGASNIIAIAAGDSFSLALRSDGSLLSWGDNAVGQLGYGATLPKISVPVTVNGANNIVAIAAGAFFSLALKADGTLLSWGHDIYGELGDDQTLQNKFTPVVANPSNIVAIAAGRFHALALKSDGTLLSWGNDDAGQLGDDDATLANKPVPVLVSSVSNIVAISAGTQHSLALKSDGTLLSWGSDLVGQLGDNSTLVNQPKPVIVSTANSIVAIAAGAYHSLALKSDGKMLSWGDDTEGELGDSPANTLQPTPVAVLLGTNLIRLP